MTIAVGDRLPEVTVREVTADGPKPRTIGEITAGRKVVIFGVPGAFTPTCHKNHLPGFLQNREALMAKGVEEIAVVSVNDPFVMSAWSDATGAREKIMFLSDGNAEFARAIGLDFDASGAGLGTRVKRFSMVVEDGVVKTLNVEDVPSKADASSATTLLGQL